MSLTQQQVGPCAEKTPLKSGGLFRRDTPLPAHAATVVADSLGIQPKLKVDPPNSPRELEADRVAEQVMRMPDSNTSDTIQRKKQPPAIRRACAARKGKKKEERRISRKEASSGSPLVTAELESRVNSLRGGGQPLPQSTQSFFGARFGRDFSDVRVHTDTLSATTSHDMNARAFTLGSDIVFGSGQFAPNSPSGKMLLAHELTHVVQQDKAGIVDAGYTPEISASPNSIQRQKSGASTSKSHPFSIKTKGCSRTPYVKATVEQAARQAFLAVRDSECIGTTSLRDRILDEFDGLILDCSQDRTGPCGQAGRYFSKTVELFPAALKAGCGPLASTILHEAIHLAELTLPALPHGDLAYACERSCFKTGKGDASKCTFETAFVPVGGVSAGGVFSAAGTPTWQARLYLGLEKRGPILGFVHPSLGVGLGLIGEAINRDAETVTGTSALGSLLAGVRLDPGDPGGGSVSFFAGPSIALGSGNVGLGAEAGVAFGYRWSWLDVSLDAGLTYDPTREVGMDRLLTVGATIRIGPSIPRK